MLLSKENKAMNEISTEKLAAYTIGESDIRPWGSYIVTNVGVNDVGEDMCEKDITVSSGKILSLQSHDHRREFWQVKSGVLTVLVDGEIHSLCEGESVVIPVHSIHCMANASDNPVVVHEVQEGICREEDISRYMDAYGRVTMVESSDPRVIKSIAAYKRLLSDLKIA